MLPLTTGSASCALSLSLAQPVDRQRAWCCAQARDFTPKKMYEHYTSSGPGKEGAVDEAGLAPGPRTHSYEPETHRSAHSDDTEETEDDEHSVLGEGEDPNHHRKRKKAAKALKKAGHAIKTVFKIPIENSDKAHGGILPCTHPTATKCGARAQARMAA